MWDKTERIKRNTLRGDITKGGLNIVDVDCKLKALRAAWIPRLQFLEQHPIPFGLSLHDIHSLSTCRHKLHDPLHPPQLFKDSMCSTQSVMTWK